MQLNHAQALIPFPGANDPTSALPFAAGQPHPESAPMDIIFIDGLRGNTVIGIHHDELHDPQPVRIDLAAGVPHSMACNTDRICDTIDYGEVRAALHELLRTHRLQLLEAFAEAIAALLLGRFGAHWVRVAVTKPNKFDDVDGVGVVIQRSRQHAAQSVPPYDAAILDLMGNGLIPGNRPA